MTPPLFTRSEAASHARVSLRSLAKRIADGTGPTVTRIGGKVFIREDHLCEWIEACANRPRMRKHAAPKSGGATAS